MDLNVVLAVSSDLARKPPGGRANSTMRIVTPLTLAQTVAWARCVPRSARMAQGFTRTDNFARHVKRVRALSAFDLGTDLGAKEAVRTNLSFNSKDLIAI